MSKTIELTKEYQPKSNFFVRTYDHVLGALAGIGLMTLGITYGLLDPIMPGETIGAAQAAEIIEEVQLSAFDPKHLPKAPVKKCKGNKC